MIRERECGTLENLLSTPVTPLEVMIAKILPNILLSGVMLPFRGIMLKGSTLTEVWPPALAHDSMLRHRQTLD